MTEPDRDLNLTLFPAVLRPLGALNTVKSREGGNKGECEEKEKMERGRERTVPVPPLDI